MDCQNVQSAIDTDFRRENANETIGFHLKSCHDCRRYTDETAGLLNLLGAQPRIEVPADFDFKLRARLARAKSDASSEGLLDRLHARSSITLGYTWGRAAAATAALAILVTITALNFTTGDRIAQSKSEAPSSQIAEKAAAAVSPTVTSSPAVTSVKPLQTVKYNHKASELTQISLSERTNDLNLAAESEIEAEKHVYTWRGFDPEKGEFITAQSRDLIGAESSASTMSKTSPYVPSI